ncbi:uncharacterized protein LOC104453959 [Eucalyptus grandis]|uniref:uncharacterized protein LOC104453959 n=1 Tax=Eucalyptus grandis TaxID=71139 RepID=UPI00192ECD53|nr:uncharacterized protein LOC104453959 [Eucalyptus grandis]
MHSHHLISLPPSPILSRSSTERAQRKKDPSPMAETSPLKRRREANPDEEEEEKRQRSYRDILSLLEEEEDVAGQDLSSLITSLQRELASGSSDPLTASAEEAPPSPAGEAGDEGGDERERVMRRLLEASDDELGLPSRESSEVGHGVGIGEGHDVLCGSVGEGQGSIDLCEGLVWELEDEATNHNALLQSELNAP